jgi:uracil-DNA glycosylase
VHPSYLLRIPEGETKAREYQAFVRDLVVIRGLMETL